MYKLLVFGAIGGLVPDVLRIIAAGRQGMILDVLKKVIFYVSLALLAVIGALAVLLVGAGSLKEAFAIGFGAPEVISRLGALAGQADRGVGQKVSLFDWWKY
jgi:hypothetical protein